MSKSLSLGIDIGTTSAQAVLIRPQGEVVYETRAEQQLISAHPGWAEEDPNEWWANTVELLRRCAATAAELDGEIASIGVSGMVPALVCLDSNGTAIRNSIQQNDARASREIDWLRGELDDERVLEACGSVISQQHIGPKIAWLRTREPENYRRIRWIMGSYDFINFRLTGTPVVEENWALESGMFHISERRWLPEVLAAAGVREEWLPPVRSGSEVIGRVTAEVARATGVQEGTPVVAGVADHVASAFAAGVSETGDLNVKIGGAGDILFCLDHPRVDRRLFIDYHPVPGKFLLNGCMASSGSVLKWFQRAIVGGAVSYAELDREAEALAPGSDGLIVLPYFLGEKTPIFDPHARGVFFGLGLHHTRAHIHRAIMEAVAFGFRHHVDIFAELGCFVRRCVVTDGGSKSALWRRIVADVLGSPVVHLESHSGSSLGAAIVAAKAIGMLSDWSELHRFVRAAGVSDPDPDRHRRYEKLYRKYRELYDHLRTDFMDLARLQSETGEGV